MNENYLSGQTSSLQAGLRAVPPDAEGVLFTLVDHPAVSLSTIDALLAPPRPLDPHAALSTPSAATPSGFRATSSPNFWPCRWMRRPTR